MADGIPSAGDVDDDLIDAALVLLNLDLDDATPSYAAASQRRHRAAWREGYEAGVAAATVAQRAQADRLATCPGPHVPVQHRDGKPPWCRTCGMDAAGHPRRQPAAPSERRIVGARPLPIPVHDLADWCAQLEGEHGPGYLKQVGQHLVVVVGDGHDPVECWCARCANTVADGILEAEDDDNFTSRLYLTSRMYLCPDCGNKRCPRSTWHGHACTRSNDSGQPGSVYGDPNAPTPPHVPEEADRG